MSDNIVELYKVEADKYDSTRDIQWKINIAIWTVLLLAIYAKAKNELSSLYNFGTLFYWILLLIMSSALYIIHYKFLHKVQRSMNKSLSRMRDMAKAIVEKVEFRAWDDIGKEIPNEQIESGKYWVRLQLSITIILALIFISINN